MEKKQTAVEFFNDEILIHLNFDQRLYLKNIFNKALEMEKEQLISFGYSQIQEIDSELGDLIYKKVPEEIYNETYKLE